MNALKSALVVCFEAVRTDLESSRQGASFQTVPEAQIC